MFIIKNVENTAEYGPAEVFSCSSGYCSCSVHPEERCASLPVSAVLRC